MYIQHWQKCQVYHFCGNCEKFDCVLFTFTFLGEITLVAVGPLTNIALALRLDEHLGSKLKDFVVMGGNIHGMFLIKPYTKISVSFKLN